MAAEDPEGEGSTEHPEGEDAAKNSAIDVEGAGATEHPEVEGEGATEHPEGAVHAEGNDDKTEPARISSSNPAPQTLHHKLSFL